MGFVAYLREDIHVVVAGLNPETFVVNPLGLGTAVELNKAVMEMMACHPGVAAVVLLGRSRQFEFESYLKVRCAQATPDPASAAISVLGLRALGAVLVLPLSAPKGLPAFAIKASQFPSIPDTSGRGAYCEI